MIKRIKRAIIMCFHYELMEMIDERIEGHEFMESWEVEEKIEDVRSKAQANFDIIEGVIR
jgi:hypothetical protein